MPRFIDMYHSRTVGFHLSDGFLIQSMHGFTEVQNSEQKRQVSADDQQN